MLALTSATFFLPPQKQAANAGYTATTASEVLPCCP